MKSALLVPGEMYLLTQDKSAALNVSAYERFSVSPDDKGRPGIARIVAHSRSSGACVTLGMYSQEVAELTLADLFAALVGGEPDFEMPPSQLDYGTRKGA